MKSKQENERHEFSDEETQRIRLYLDLQTKRLEVISLLDNYSSSFADWSVIISEAVHEAMAKKEDCAKERAMLENLTFLFTKLAYHSETISEWRKELGIRVGNTEKMIE